MSNYLVTGGAGFIGSNIVKRLVEDGQRVSVIDDFSTGRIENISPFLKQIEFFEGSITDSNLLVKALHGVDYVLHQAAIPSVGRSIKDPLRSNNANICGTLSLLTVLKDIKIKCLVCASSSSVYGNTPKLPKREDFAPNPLSPYAVTKLTGEYYVKVFSELYGINSVCLRYFNVFGPNQDPNSDYSAVIPKFIKTMLKGERPVIYGDGNQSRDFTFVENVVSANLLACSKMKNSKGTVINIACGKRYNLKKIVSSINSSIGGSIKPDLAERRSGDVKHSLADISKAKRLLGYKPLINFQEGLDRTIRWIKDKYEN